MLGRLGRETFALWPLQSDFLLLQGMPEAELETSQARLYGGYGASTLHTGGNGSRTRVGETAANGTSSEGCDVFTQSLNQA